MKTKLEEWKKSISEDKIIPQPILLIGLTIVSAIITLSLWVPITLAIGMLSAWQLDTRLIPAFRNYKTGGEYT